MLDNKLLALLIVLAMFAVAICGLIKSVWDHAHDRTNTHRADRIIESRSTPKSAFDRTAKEVPVDQNVP
jgi:hypothetical protein